MTETQAMAICLGRGVPREFCEDSIADQRVDGVYCDGTVVIGKGGSRRCVPRSLVEQTRAARAAAPLPAPPIAVIIDPSTSTEPNEAETWIILGVGVALVVALLALRRL